MTTFSFDVREHTLFAAFQSRVPQTKNDIVSESVALPMADVIVRTPGMVIAVERKCLPDLMMSLFDGRLVEQRNRMHDWQQATTGGGGEAWVVIIVEGALRPDTLRATARQPAEQRYKLCVKTMLQMALEDHRPDQRRLVLRTTSEDESAALLLTLQKTIAATQQGATSAARAGDTSTMLKRTHAPPLVRHLCCTLGISQKRAEGAVSHWPNVAALLDAMRSDPVATEGRLSAVVGGAKLAARIWTDLGVDPPNTPKPTKRRRPASSSRNGQRPDQKRDGDVCKEQEGGESHHGPLLTRATRLHVKDEEGGSHHDDAENEELPGATRATIGDASTHSCAPGDVGPDLVD